MNTTGLGAATTIYFAGNSTFTISTFTINGDATYPVVLKSTDTAGWYLNNTSQNNVSYVAVEYSSASAGIEIDNTTGGVNLENNFNWTFPAAGPSLITSNQTGPWHDTNTWVGGVIPVLTDTVTINASHVVTATSAVTVASITVNASGELDFSASTQAVTFTIANGGKLINNGVVKVASANYNTSLEGESGGQFTFEGTDIDYNGRKIYLGRVIYQPSVTLGSGESLELSDSTTFYAFTAQSGSSFIHGANNEVHFTSNTVLAGATFTKATGTGRVFFSGNSHLV